MLVEFLGREGTGESWPPLALISSPSSAIVKRHDRTEQVIRRRSWRWYSIRQREAPVPVVISSTSQKSPILQTSSLHLNVLKRKKNTWTLNVISGFFILGFRYLKPEADLGMFSMFGRTGARPHKKGAPTGQRLSEASTTFSDLWGGAYLCCIATFKTCIYRMFLYINVRKFYVRAGPPHFYRTGSDRV